MTVMFYMVADALQRTRYVVAILEDAVSDCPKDTFFFFDPPYRESFADYGNGFSDEQLIDLISFCDKQACVMLSNRDDED